VSPQVETRVPTREELDRIAGWRQREDARIREERLQLPPWVPSNPAKWRTALTGYVPAVKFENVKSLGSARSTFARYANGMHKRIHPPFAESFLASRYPPFPKTADDGRPLFARLEIVLTAEGHIKQMGVVRTSGLPDFDRGALDAVDRVAPFAAPPADIVSQDGNVYVHWEFHSEETIACSTINTSPFLLITPAALPPSAPSPPSSSSPPAP
jgi:TonB family protein